MKAIILAAGLGTRLKPFTDTKPKALYPINSKTLLQRSIEYLQRANIHEIVINIHHHGDKIIQFLKANDNFGCSIQISDESQGLLETGGGLVKAKDFLNKSDFVLLNVDILTHLDLQKMIDYHKKHQPLATLAVSKRKSSRQLEFDKDFSLCGWKNLNTGEHLHTNKKAVHELAFSGIHIINPELFDWITETHKFSIMKPYLRLMHEHTIKGYDHTGTKVLDAGKPEAISLAEDLFK